MDEASGLSVGKKVVIFDEVIFQSNVRLFAFMYTRTVRFGESVIAIIVDNIPIFDTINNK